MVTNSDLEKWKKAVEGIEAGQNNLSPEELSAFHALKELFNSGNFESNESSVFIKTIKDTLPKHGNHRLLQKVHLPSFINLCETYFKSETKTVIPPSFTPPSFTPPTFEPPIFEPPIIQPPTFQPPVIPKITPPEPVVEKSVITEPVPPAPPIIAPDIPEGKTNKIATKSNKQLILILVAIALLIAGWLLYKNCDTVRKVNNDSTISEQTEPIDTASVAESIKDSTVIAQTAQENEGTVSGNSSKIIVKTYSFGIYKGSAINGYPEGDGKMTYRRQIQIAIQDTKSPPHFTENGDYFVGSWGNGDIVSGTLYDKNGNVKEKILAPKRYNLHDISND